MSLRPAWSPKASGKEKVASDERLQEVEYSFPFYHAIVALRGKVVSIRKCPRKR